MPSDLNRGKDLQLENPMGIWKTISVPQQYARKYLQCVNIPIKSQTFPLRIALFPGEQCYYSVNIRWWVSKFANGYPRVRIPQNHREGHQHSPALDLWSKIFTVLISPNIPWRVISLFMISFTFEPMGRQEELAPRVTEVPFRTRIFRIGEARLAAALN